MPSHFLMCANFYPNTLNIKTEQQMTLPIKPKVEGRLQGKCKEKCPFLGNYHFSSNEYFPEKENSQNWIPVYQMEDPEKMGSGLAKALTGKSAIMCQYDVHTSTL